MDWLDIRRRFYYISSFVLILLLIILIYQQAPRFRLISPALPIELGHLPYYAWCSFYRMLIAYVCALSFAVVYGYIAATNSRAERIMIPALDILQSIPVLGFFPAAIYLFINIAPGRLGVEIASIFLIFMNQVWNMAFGVYEALVTLPEDSKEAVDSYGVRGWLKFRTFLFPACIPKLVYNSIMSWAGGWYFLIACEIIALGPINYKLPGLGSFLIRTTETGDLHLALIGLGTLMTIIVLMDIFLWRPLSVWAEKFRYEFAVSTMSPQESWILDWMQRQKLLVRTARWTSQVIDGFFTRIENLFLDAADSNNRIARLRSWIKYIALWLFLIFFAYGCFRAFRTMIVMLSKPWPERASQIPSAILASTLRLTVAYFIALAWTLPLAIWVGESQRVAKIVTPLAEIGASIPATALFPLIVFVVIKYATMNVASVLLILTGMQWYLLFNLIAGVRNIPGDLKEAVRSFGVRGRDYWRRLIIPAIFPSLITGSITAWGGGWNALIVSEYLVYNQRTYSVLGIGALLDEATFRTGDTTMILLSLLSMVTVVVLINRLFWRRLYARATEKFKIAY